MCNSKPTQNQHENCELKPCPFCGGEVELLDYTDKIYGFWDYKIKCKKCRAYMDSPSTGTMRMLSNGIETIRNQETMQKAKRELIIIWNTRTPKERGGGK